MSRFPLLSKIVAIGLVMLLLTAVLARIDGLVAERRWRQSQAAAGVEQSLAGAQTLVGPLLQRVCAEEWDSTSGEGKEQRRTVERREFTMVSAPQTLQVSGDVRAEPRYRGLFKVNGYAGKLTLEARWPGLRGLQPQALHGGSRLSCGQVFVMLSVSDVRGLRAAQVQVDGASLPVRPGTGHARLARGLHVLLDERRGTDADSPLAATVSLDLLGTTSLALVPAAEETTWTLHADWPHPSFGGRFLPATREISATGFDARWTVSSLASAAATDVRAAGELCALPAAAAYDGAEAAVPVPAAQAGSCLDTLAVSFIDPVNPYVLTDRATKYALLFIVLTFGSVALTEVLAGRRVHPVQYTLVGLALALFYLLLLSLSEHIAFGRAYAAASAACVLLLGFYARHMLGRWRAGLAFGGGVALLYAALWALLQMEQTALVIGSLLLFAVLAAVMVLTRRVDWYALLGRGALSPSAPPSPSARA